MYAWNLAILPKTINLQTLIDFPFLSIHGFWVKYREMKSERVESFIRFLIEEHTWKMIWEDLFAWATMAIIIEFTTISAGICMTFKIQYLKLVEKTYMGKHKLKIQMNRFVCNCLLKDWRMNLTHNILDCLRMAKNAFQFPFAVGSNYTINGSVTRKFHLTKRESIMKIGEKKKSRIVLFSWLS